jgi:hypothetical protein
MSLQLNDHPQKGLQEWLAQSGNNASELFYSPKTGSMSDMAIYHQIRGGIVRGASILVGCGKRLVEQVGGDVVA